MTSGEKKTNTAFFELRYAAEKGAEAFRDFITQMTKAAEEEKRRLAQSREDATIRAKALEEEYQAWKAQKVASEGGAS